MDENTMPYRSVAVQPRSAQVSVGLGESAPIVFDVINHSEQDDYFEITVQGIPAAWLLLDMPVIHLSPGERREIGLTVQAPGNSPVSIGSYPVTIQVASQKVAALRGQGQFNLLVTDSAAVTQAPTADGSDRIGVILHTTQFAIAPGDTLSIPIVVANRGMREDTFLLSVDGLPTEWVSAESSALRLIPGEHREAVLFIQPPFDPLSRAGRHPFSIRVTVQSDPRQFAAVDSLLTLAAVSQFQAEISPRRVNAGQPIRVLVNNIGNTPDTFTVAFHSPEDALEFVPQIGGPLQLMPGDTGMVDFVASPRSPNWVGSPAVMGYTVSVQPAAGPPQMFNGEIVSRSLIPVWVFPVLGVLCLGLLCGMGFLWNWNQNRLMWARETQDVQAGMAIQQTVTAAAQGTLIAAGDISAAQTATAAAMVTPTATMTVTPEPPTETPAPSETPPPPTSTPEPPTPTVPPDTPVPPTEAPQPTAVTLPVGGDQVFVFSSDRDGGSGLYLFRSTGGAPARILDTGGADTQPAWSPDGNLLAFTSNRDGNNEIYVVNADGSGLANLTNNPSNDSYPAWSPDGRQLLFVSNRDGNNEIYRINADGSEPTNLTRSPSNDFKPAWYSQRELINTTSGIVFTSDRDGNNEIYSMNPDGSEPVNLTQNPANDSLPSVPYGGGQVAFVSDRDGNLEIYSMGADGSGQTNLTKNPAADSKPAWSRDGQWIIFTTDRDGNREVYIMAADGSSPTNISNSPGDDFDPTWR